MLEGLLLNLRPINFFREVLFIAALIEISIKFYNKILKDY